jgi:predicted amidohydrolase
MTPRVDGPRPAVVGTCSLASPQSAGVEERLADRLEMIDLMAREAELKEWVLDIVLVPEVSAPDTIKRAIDGAEDMSGPTIAAMAQKARRYGTYVAVPMHVLDGGRAYNSVVLLDRDGEPVGRYDKAFPVTMSDGSLEHGVTPGRAFPVFDLDFGRVAVQICWDVAFPDGWQALADQDAELVLYPTSPISMTALRGHAQRHNYYIVGSVHRVPAAVIGPAGNVIATTTADREVLVVRVDLDYEVLNTNCLWEWPESKRREWAGRIKLEWHEDEYLYVLTSLDPEWPVRRFLAEEGLLTGRQRRARNLRLLDEARGPLPGGVATNG